MKTAIVYDRVNKWGGAEKVLLEINKIFPDAPLYCAVYDPQKALWAEIFPKVIPSFLNKIPFARGNHELLGFLTPIAFESFNFDEYDLVVSVTSESAKGIITKPHTKHICYCMTPTRYLWSGYEEYQKNPPKKLLWIPFYRIISKPLLDYVKSWDMVAATRPDKYIAISGEVKKRIKKYYNRDSEIIFPPVEAEKFRTQRSKISISPKLRRAIKNENSNSETGNLDDYYLIVGRLVPYKKVDLAIRAFNKLGKKLVVIGKGSEDGYLHGIAGKNIVFKGFLPDEGLPDWFRNAKAFIYPQEEDFGITAVEAQAAGIPVIAYKKGGALDTVVDGVTGVFFEEQTERSLISAVQKFEMMKFDKKKIIDNSVKYNSARFRKQFIDLLKKTV